MKFTKVLWAYTGGSQGETQVDKEIMIPEPSLLLQRRNIKRREELVEESKVDTKAQLPYRVPVDIMVRTFQVIILLFGLFLLGICLSNLRHPEPFSWGMGILLTLYGAYLQFHSSGLVLDEQGIHYTSVFGRRKGIQWEEISKVVSGTQDFNLKGIPLKGNLGKVNPRMGPYLMIFVRKDGADHYLLNFKPYSVKGLATMVHFITLRTIGADIDEKTRKMMNGIFPSIFFGEQTGHG